MRLFATVGTHTQGFSRLFKELEKLKEKNKDWQIYAQIGYTKYKPKNYIFKKFLEDKEYTEWFDKADVVISHGGAGTIIGAVTRKKPLIIVPRLYKFDEHTNNHQLELAKAVEERGLALVVVDIKELEKGIRKSQTQKHFESKKMQMALEIKQFLVNVEHTIKNKEKKG